MKATGVENLYEMFINGFINAKVGKTVYNIACEVCSDTACNSVLESYTTVKQVYRNLDISNMVTVSSSEDVNGATNATYKFSMQLVSEMVA